MLSECSVHRAAFASESHFPTTFLPQTQGPKPRVCSWHNSMLLLSVMQKHTCMHHHTHTHIHMRPGQKWQRRTS